MHALAWVLMVWGASAEPELPLGDTVAIYTSEEKCVAAGMDRMSGTGKHPTGVHYRCVSMPLDPPLGQAYDARDYRTVSGRAR